MEFPIVNDINIPGMGEIEGHYQPIIKPSINKHVILKLKAPIIHHAFKDYNRWVHRHAGYAEWEDGMNDISAWPKEDSSIRNILKTIFRNSPFFIKYITIFSYSFVLKLSFLDGLAGLQFSHTRAKYYLR